ncbi:MAG TPA: chaperone modulator CbpM [Burkholderiales bacterium]|jgi:chaperone modulatory protein CbpM
MRVELTEAVWLEERTELSLDELTELSGLPADMLRELVDCGVLVPAATGASQWRLTSASITAVQTAGRLRSDFELDTSALALVVRLLDRIQRLETQLQHLRAQMPR